MITNLTRYIVYFCHNCCDVNCRVVTPFNLPKRKKLELPCRHSCCSEAPAAVTAKGEKVNIDMTCPFCGKIHHFSLSRSTFWTKKHLSLVCPIMLFPIFNVSAELGHAMLELQKIIEALPAFFDKMNGDDDLSIMFNIIERINELVLEKRITCVCGENAIKISLLPESVLLKCSHCGRQLEIQALRERLEELKSSSSITITD